MVKKLLVLSLFAVLFAGCASEPEIVDNGSPGTIKVVAFQDENRNKTLDGSEPGAVVDIALSQDISCPGGDDNALNRQTTDAKGQFSFANLDPGKYCVMLISNVPTSTPVAVEVFLSSGQEALVQFALTEQP